MFIKHLLKKIIPKLLLKFIRKIRVFFLKNEFKDLSVEQSFTKIYKENRWGSNSDFEYFSGRGSHDKHIILPYIDVIIDFINNKNMDILDLGCGDFNVGSKLAPFAKHYIGADIVQKLILHNSIKFSHLLNTTFIKLSITEDEWPDADIVILRQVLQHLSNKDILNILPKLYNYKYIIITEGLPNRDFVANKENFTGPDIRLSLNSGIVLDLPPFNFKYKHKLNLIDIHDEKDEAVLRTTLYKLF
jgi:SAM-dependent methyltransferase